MKSLFDLFCRLIMLVLTVRLAAAPSIEISTGSPASSVRLSLSVEDRVATRAPQAPDLATAYWVVTPLPVVVRSGSAYYGAVRSINAHGDVLGNDLSVIKHIAADGTVSELGSHNFHFNGGRQLDDAGRVVLNTKFGNEGLLFTVAGASPSVGVRYPGTRLTSLDNAGGLLGVTLSQTVQSDQDYWGLHFVEREDRRRDLELPADSNFGADLMALNERDEVVGGAFQIPVNRWRGLYLKPGRAPRWLPGFGQYEDAYNLNVHGQLVGSTSVPAGFGYAPGVYPALWDSGAVGRVKVLDTDRSLFGGEYGWAWAANRWGHIVGRTRSGGALWLDGQPHDLTGRIINPDNIRLDYFADINDKGEIVGAEYGFLTSPRTFVMRPVWPSLAVDLNRDGKIALPLDGDKSDVTSAAMPFRFWINDDDDDGDLSNNDVPGQLPSVNGGMVAAPGADWRTLHNEGVVDGTADLIDFFPVFLDIKQLVAALPHTTAGVTYKLRHADEALNFVYTNKTRTEALNYLRTVLNTGLGPDFTQSAGSAGTEKITAAGVVLKAEFLDGITDDDWGVILLEGRAASSTPLCLVIEKDGAEMANFPLHIKVSPVEQMFRHVNLTTVPKNYDGSAPNIPETAEATRTGEPAAYPDSLTNGKYFVFVHGYNVHAQKARGWQAEVFKRMYALGSKARFVGVTWHGATGLDYHRAVYHAFQTGDALADALTITGAADVTVAAHSLGNMVVGHAIQSGGFTPSRYYMINAATPLEAYALGDVGPDEALNMTEQAWRSYVPRLYASNWHELFSHSDNRSRLTWRNLFVSVRTRSETHNFYSEEEDVVSDANDNTSASVMATMLKQGFDVSTGAWKAQELVKGVDWSTSLVSIFMERGQSGWGFNPYWDDVYGDPSIGIVRTRMSPEHAAMLSDALLMERPFFGNFLEPDLVSISTSIGSVKADDANVLYDLFARGIPATSNAAAANFMMSLDPNNYAMHTEGKVATNGPFPTPENVWRHSDFKDVALPYVYPMYEEMISRGALK